MPAPDPLPVPDLCQEAEAVFWKLSRRRGTTGAGTPEPITYSEVDSYTNTTGTLMTPHDVEVVMALDDAFLNAWHTEADIVQSIRRQKAENEAGS